MRYWVSSVTALDKRRIRVTFTADGAGGAEREESMILDGNDCSRFGIREGAVLDERVFRDLMETVLKPGARRCLLRSLQAADRTEEELRRLLARKGFPGEAAEDALAMARRYRYIDDEAYARRYLEQEGKKKSRRQLSAQMQRKGFSGELIRRLLEEQPPDERQQIRAILEKKGFAPGQQMDAKQYARLTAMLARRGYTYEQVADAMGGWARND